MHYEPRTSKNPWSYTITRQREVRPMNHCRTCKHFRRGRWLLGFDWCEDDSYPHNPDDHACRDYERASIFERVWEWVRSL